MKKLIIFILAFCMLVPYTTYASDQNDILDSTAKYLVENVTSPTVASVGGEWLIIGLARGDFDIPKDYFEEYYQNVCNTLKQKDGILHSKKYTEYSRVVMALSAIGKNPENVAGYNLLIPLSDYEKVVWQGLNGPIYALIALDCKDYQITQSTKQMYLDYIINAQNEDGGFGLTKDAASDIDVTAMAIQALAKYKDDPIISSAIEKALSYVSSVQNESGFFLSNSTKNIESTAQVITALATLDIPLTDGRFVKNGNSITDGLLSFYINKKGFAHTPGSNEVNLMATEQALYAMVALERMENNKNPLYDMSDVKIDTDMSQTEGFGLKDKNENIKIMPVLYEGRTFDDIVSNRYKEQIEALSSRGIINGKTDKTFDPDSTMTRAEFATITVKALGLTVENNSVFEDVLESDWYYGYVATAYNYGIINGVSKTHFNPNGVITREEAAVMISRCAKLCGAKTDLSTDVARNILAQFDDYTLISDWALSSMAFCVENKILIEDSMDISSKKLVTRDEIAFMLYNLLDITKLL